MYVCMYGNAERKEPLTWPMPPSCAVAFVLPLSGQRVTMPPPHLGMSLPPLVWTSQPATRVEVRGAL
jgi:hypothetical protein